MFIILSLSVFSLAHWYLLGTTNNDGIVSVMIVSIAVNFVFTIELIVHFAIFGFRRALHRKSQLYYEIVLQIVFFISLKYFLKIDFNNQSFALILNTDVILFRVLRLLYLVAELQQFRILFEACKRLATPFVTMLLTLYTVYFIYALIGELWFGGKISTMSAQVNDPGIPALYYLMNFNDFTSSLITLFTLMVINNWYNTTNMLCDIVGNSWPIVFTFSFIVVITWLMLSLLIAFVLEIHG